ncbi:MAG: Fic/DOC family N-terminal domain-containing protein [Owenweeksia sp.]|nr:Fic/DOC family N-terminal domain-containing protein [Owenweeksia sp.]
MTWQPKALPYPHELETKTVLRQMLAAHRALAELKGVAQSIPRQEILINTLALQEAKDSSAVENIVTTHDEMYKSTLEVENLLKPAAKEVRNYANALRKGFNRVREKGIITAKDIKAIQAELEKNNAGFRKLPGTSLKNQATGAVVASRHNTVTRLTNSWPTWSSTSMSPECRR